MDYNMTNILQYIEKTIVFLISIPLVLLNQADKVVNVASPTKTTIVFTGDVMLGRSVMGESLDNNDLYYPFRNVSSYLRDSDITMVNLENPITKNCQRTVGGYTFCTTPEIARGLSYSGVDIVNLANNHTLNYGKDGFSETQKYLGQMGIKYVGKDNLEIIRKNGTVFGFLGFDLVSNGYDLEKIYKLTNESDKQVDVLIVNMHWGNEYESEPNSLQKTVAKKLVQNGADIITGHHPHWVQSFDYVEGIPTYYSLGNFIFDQSWSEKTKEGLLVKFSFDGSDIDTIEEKRVYMRNFAQPEFVD